ncbi:hypothetical protein F4678DRAFT_424257 [Xylaria arbuscula]|nr:hypothetical protein F4678DRAFT_424257 [Xylaria arbuscula]
MAPPPPATPTPHRFLVPRRSQPHGGETPKPKPAAAFQPSSQQFHATPRFSLHSTPRNAPSSASRTPFRHRPAEPDDVIDSSPPPLPGTTRRVSYGDYDEDHEDHEDDDENQVNDDEGFDHDFASDRDDVVQESSPIRVESDDEDHDMSEKKRVKRRRLSISPPAVGIEESSPLPEIEYEPDVEMQDTISGIESSISEPSISENDVDLDISAIQDSIENPGGVFTHHEEKPSKAHQPMFQKAPRFKPPELPEGAPYPEPLPDAFSPRRKGAKYVPGGLAAELRDWLVDVEAGVGSVSGSTVRSGEEWIARIQVDDISGAKGGARGMTLILGRQVLNRKSDAIGDSHISSEAEQAAETLGNDTLKLILAGPGRLSGLGVGSNVRPGVVLGIGRPTWEVVLEGLGRWGVACDWVVLD